MNAITQITEITNAALNSRGLLPLDGHCSCAACGASDLDQSEMADAGQFTGDHFAKVQALHGRNLCFECVDGASFEDDDEFAIDYSDEIFGWEQAR